MSEYQSNAAEWFKTWYAGNSLEVMIGFLFFYVIIPVGIVIWIGDVFMELFGINSDS